MYSNLVAFHTLLQYYNTLEMYSTQGDNYQMYKSPAENIGMPNFIKLIINILLQACIDMIKINTLLELNFSQYRNCDC